MKEFGYEISIGQVPESKILAVWKDLHLLVVNQLHRLKIPTTVDMKSNLELLLNADKRVYINTIGLASRLKSTLDLCYGVESFGPLALYYPVMHVMSESLKIPDGYWGTEAHQDWASTQGSLDTTTVWIPLTPTKDNFSLEVIPGSHRHGLLDGVTSGSVLKVEAEGEFIPLDIGFGDVILMSGFLVHRTGKGNGLRIAVSMRFENVCEHTFIGRGYPSAQKRTVDREILWKPTKEQVQNVG